MIGQSLDTTAGPRPASLDERVFGSPTTLRFILLLLLLVAGGAGLSESIAYDLTGGRIDNTLGCALASGLNPEAGFYAGSAGSIMGNWAALEACWAHFVPDMAWVPLVVVPTLILAAAALYVVLPWWKGRRSRFVALEQVDVDGRLRHDLDALVAEAGLRVRVRFGVDPGAVTAGAVVFGTRRRPVVRLHSGLLVTHRTDPARFRAVVLHELAHVRNGDVGVTYATVAMWRVFLGAVLLPAACAEVYDLAIVRVPATWHFLSLHVWVLVEEALIVVMVYLTRADILRTREMYADLTAAQRWQVRPNELVDERVPATSPRSTRRRALAAIGELWRTHPSWPARLRTLAAPDALFSLGVLPMFTTGLIADIFAGQLDSLLHAPAALRTVNELLTAGLITAIGGVAVWRAVRYALVQDRTAPSGWLAGFWLGTGLAVGELVNGGATGEGWLPPYPETLAILIVTVMLLTAWIAQYAQLRIRTRSVRSWRAAMLIGLIPPWLVLVFALSWWNLDTPYLGWLPSGADIFNGLGLSTDHPPLLIRIGAVLASLPGSGTTFAGLWWALPLLWLLPLVLWARRRHDSTPGLRPIMRAGLLGGLASGIGLLVARVGVDTVRGLGSGAADSAAEFGWIVLVITAAMLVTAAVVGATSSAYPLLAALIASGVVALVGTLIAYLQLTVDGCLGPANVLFTHHCAVRPTFPVYLFESWTGYVLGAATLACLGAAAVAHVTRTLLRRRRSDTPVTANADVPTRTRRQRVAPAIVLTATVAVIATETLQATLSTPIPVSSAMQTHVFRQGPAPSELTEKMQLWAWLDYGGMNLSHRIDTVGDTTLHVITEVAHASDRQSTLNRLVPPACAQLIAVTNDADNYFAVPGAEGQRIWANLIDALNSAATACHRAERAHDPTNFVAAHFDIWNAEDELTTLLEWIGPAGTLGVKPIVAMFGEYQPLVYNGVALRFTAANLSIRPADTNADQVPPADRIATLNVQVCLADVPLNTELVGGHPGWQGWRLVFPDGTRVAPARTWSPRDFDAPLYPPTSQGDFTTTSDCVAGLVPFDIPAAEQGTPQQVLFAPTVVTTTLAWNVRHAQSADFNILGTAQQVIDGGPADWMAVTGYSVHTAGRNQNRVPAGDRIATITAVACMSNIPATTPAAWSPWTLLLANGLTAAPARSWPASNATPPLYPNGSANIGSHHNCRSGSIPFDIPAADKADPVEIAYNSTSTNLFWQMTPPSQ